MKFGSANIDAIRFGSDAVSKVYFGSTQVWSGGSQTFYFLGTPADGGWDSLGNWYMDAIGAVPASSLPSETDNVIALSSITGSGTPVANMTLGDATHGGIYLQGTHSVGGLLTVSNGSWVSGVVNGTVVFEDDSYNAGTINGDATFYGSSDNAGTVNGDATFYGTSSNNGTVSWQAYFYESSYHYGHATEVHAYDSAGMACDAIALWGITTWNSSSPMPQYGCTDPSATNYSAWATCDDYSCCYPDAYYEYACVGCDQNSETIYDSCGQVYSYWEYYDPTECGWLC